jgi:hypothetical protein
MQADSLRNAGTIIDACRHPEGGYELLAVVTIEYAEGGKVLLGGPDEAALEFKPLSYAFDPPLNQNQPVP